jgi:hypothetical protein
MRLSKIVFTVVVALGLITAWHGMAPRTLAADELAIEGAGCFEHAFDCDKVFPCWGYEYRFCLDTDPGCSTYGMCGYPLAGYFYCCGPAPCNWLPCRPAGAGSCE